MSKIPRIRRADTHTVNQNTGNTKNYQNREYCTSHMDCSNWPNDYCDENNSCWACYSYEYWCDSIDDCASHCDTSQYCNGFGGQDDCTDSGGNCCDTCMGGGWSFECSCWCDDEGAGSCDECEGTGPPDDEGCPFGEILDCDYNCCNESWLGDGWCDDDYNYCNFNCEDFEWDLGDCNGQSCPDDMYLCDDGTCVPDWYVQCEYSGTSPYPWCVPEINYPMGCNNDDCPTGYKRCMDTDGFDNDFLGSCVPDWYVQCPYPSELCPTSSMFNCECVEHISMCNPSPPVNPNAGDVNLDGVVNVVDIVQMINWILQAQPLPNPWQDEFINADINQDGMVNISDLLQLVDSFLDQGRISRGQHNRIVKNVVMGKRRHKTGSEGTDWKRRHWRRKSRRPGGETRRGK